MPWRRSCALLYVKKGNLFECCFNCNLPQRYFTTVARGWGEIKAKDVNAKEKVHKRQPVIFFLGGGMAAGKSSLRNTLLAPFGHKAVVIEADDIKQHDVLYQRLKRSSLGAEGADVALHEFSTNAANAMLVAAVNAGKDILMDGTFTWRPFVEQTIKMLRRAHITNFKQGSGYTLHSDGSVTESYFEPATEHPDKDTRLPYRIELYGVTTDPSLAVARGILRAIESGRAVPVAPQLRSHALFAQAFPYFASLVDRAHLFHTGDCLSLFCKENSDDVKLVAIAQRDNSVSDAMLIDPVRYAEFEKVGRLDHTARCRFELYSSSYLHRLMLRKKEAAQLTILVRRLCREVLTSKGHSSFCI